MPEAETCVGVETALVDRLWSPLNMLNDELVKDVTDGGVVVVDWPLSKDPAATGNKEGKMFLQS